MDASHIEQEVRRLAPWYYAFDLNGVSTTIVEPFDQHGHRRVDVTAISRDLWKGKSILDVGCNEGGWSFSALDHGAGPIEAFDCRQANVDKAKFVASVRDHKNVEFAVNNCDDWIRQNPGKQFDYVFMCGLLYHLVEPWRSIQEYCSVAREGALVTTLLHGGPDGYTPFPEIETIGASEDPSVLSMMPNTLNTVMLEFAKYGMYPRYFWESRYGEFWGTCNIWFQRWLNCPNTIPWAGSNRTGRRVLISFFPRQVVRESATEARLEFEFALYNETHEDLDVSGVLEVRDVNGDLQSTLGPIEIQLPARSEKGGGDCAATVLAHDVALQGEGARFYVDAKLLDGNGQLVDSAAIRVGRDG